jgi:hypothetical protein
MQGRSWWLSQGGAELEGHLKSAPFETYQLWRGQGTAGLLDEGKHVCGVFKGIIRVLDKAKAAKKPPPPMVDMHTLANPKPYRIRVYVIKALQLMSMDAGGLSDPFLKIRLGEQEIDDVEHTHQDTVAPEFYRTFELQTELPGNSQLQIEVWDHDDFSPNELIGRTTVDLEDRLFHQSWKKLTQPGFEEKAAKEGAIKPIESRSLWSGGSTNPQGAVQLWVDILSPDESKKFEKVQTETLELHSNYTITLTLPLRAGADGDTRTTL